MITVSENILYLNYFLSAIMLVVAATLGAILALFFDQNRRWNGGIHLCNAFAGGAFLSLGLVHILQDAVEEIEAAELLLRYNNRRLNPTCVLALAGYMLILFFEAAFGSHDKIEDPLPTPKENTELSEKEYSKNPLQAFLTNQASRPLEGSYIDDYPNRNHDLTDEKANNLDQCSQRTSTTRSFSNLADTIPTISDNSIIDRHKDLEYSAENGLSLKGRADNTQELPISKIGDDCYLKNASNSPINKSSSTTILLLALAIHGVFEGMIVGTKRDLSTIWLSTVTILGHKWAEGMALVSQCLSTTVNRRHTLIRFFIFALSSPIGVFIGSAITSTHPSIVGVSNAIGAGTVIYVATEITSSVFSSVEKRKTKFVAYLTGASIVTAVTMIDQLYS